MNWRRVWIWARPNKAGKTTYYLRWYGDDGRIKSESCRCGDRRLAEELRRERERALNAGELGLIEPIRLRAWIDEDLQLRRRTVRPRTLDEDGRVLRALLEGLGDLPLDALSRRRLEGWLSERTALVAQATVNKELRILRAAFGRAMQRNYLRANPLEGIRPAREAEHEPRALTADQVERLLASCTGDWRCFVFLALTTGLRRGEICQLEWTDADLARGLLHVRCKDEWRPKGGHNRILPLVPEVATMLGERHLQYPATRYIFETARGRPWRWNLLRSLRRIAGRAGIDQCTIHDLRRTFLSHLQDVGVPLAVAKHLAGHSSERTTMRHYTRALPDSVAQAPARLPWVRKEKP